MNVMWLLVFAFLALTCVQCQEEEDVFEKELKDAIEMADDSMKTEVENDILAAEKGIDTLKQNTDYQAGLFSPLDDDAAKAVYDAKLQLKTLKRMVAAGEIDPYRLTANKKHLKIWKKKFNKYCTKTYQGDTCDPDAIYRTADGTCNNLKNPSWGAIFGPQLREIPAMYDDVVDEPRKRDRLGNPLPSARLVSNIVHSVKGKSPLNEKLTVMVMQWGQFIDHDFVATPVLKGEGGTNIQCCDDAMKDRSQCFHIPIPYNDGYFNKTCMNFVRSAPVEALNCDPGFREQMNQVTSYIDGSGIYGSKPDIMLSLRTMSGGLLKTVDTGDNLLPKNLPTKCVLDKPGDYCQKSGDARVNVVPSLGFSHTVMFREHNRIVKELSAVNPEWDDETLFQQTRKIIGAVIQHINYDEYLPAILNPETMKKYKLTLSKGFSSSYKATTNPTIANVFAAAAFRFGHSQIPDYQATMTKAYTFSEKIPIQLTYHQPHMIIVNHGKALDGIARWLSADPTPLADSKFDPGNRNLLFLDKDGNSLDLPALNIQRGRDHGIPAYNHWRVHCKLDVATMSDYGFNLPDHTNEEAHKLELAYSHVDDIDLFPGAMTETHLPNSSVGPTFACLLGLQFGRIKKGDRFWYETQEKNIRFTKKQLREIKKISLAKVLCDNFDIDTMQPDVMHVPGPGNERAQCSDIPGIDLSKWKSCTSVDGRPQFKKCSGKKKYNK